MKNPKRPTRRQRELIHFYKVPNPGNWLVERDTPDELVLVHKYTNTKMQIRR